MKRADCRQVASAVLMIRPVRFGYNAETAATNAFQRHDLGLSPDEVRRRALDEFDRLASLLRARGVYVAIFEDTLEPIKLDSVFPNNWVSFYRDGDVILYPMLAESRRAEVRRSIVEELRERHGFAVAEQIDLTDTGTMGGVLEGTGSLVLDRVSRHAFACLSPRTAERAVREFGRRFGYETYAFNAVDTDGLPVYHTNVVMTLGDRFAVVCLDAIRGDAARDTIRQRLIATDHEIVPISIEQMCAFAGNMLQLTNDRGDSLLVASEQAHESLSVVQRRVLERFCDWVVAPLPTIEHYGGGSARCMLAEIFLPRA